VPRSVLLIGPILGAVTRSLVPATVVLIVGLLLGAELPGGIPGLVALYVASGRSAPSRGCGASSWP